MRYLYDNWNEISNEILDAGVILFLFDYDGTLTPIVSKPEEAVISQDTRNLLQKLSENKKVKLGIISGRSIKDIENLVGLREIYYVGNHGYEIQFPSGKIDTLYSSEQIKPVKEAANELKKELSEVQGIIFEDKGPIVSIHYRNVARIDIPFVHEKITHLEKLFGKRVKFGSGKKVMELRPMGQHNKATAVSGIKEDVIDKQHVITIYVGDDLTDEDVFGILGEGDIGIFVGKSQQRSKANFYVNNVDEVKMFIKKVLAILSAA